MVQQHLVISNHTRMDVWKCEECLGADLGDHCLIENQSNTFAISRYLPKYWYGVVARYTIRQVFDSTAAKLRVKIQNDHDNVNTLSRSSKILRWSSLRASAQRPWNIRVEHRPEHHDVIKWKPFPRYWPFVNSPHKGRWRARFDVFFDLRMNKRLSKQSWGWWFETPSCSLWRHCNAMDKLWKTTLCVVFPKMKVKMHGFWTKIYKILSGCVIVCLTQRQIWLQFSPQQCCRDNCQISEQSDSCKHKCRGC